MKKGTFLFKGIVEKKPISTQEVPQVTLFKQRLNQAISDLDLNKITKTTFKVTIDNLLLELYKYYGIIK